MSIYPSLYLSLYTHSLLRCFAHPSARSAGATTESLLNDMFKYYLKNGARLVTMQKLPELGWLTDRTQLYGTKFGKSWTPDDEGYGVYVYEVNRHWKCSFCTYEQQNGFTDKCEVCDQQRRAVRDSEPSANLKDSLRF